MIASSLPDWLPAIGTTNSCPDQAKDNFSDSETAINDSAELLSSGDYRLYGATNLSAPLLSTSLTSIHPLQDESSSVQGDQTIYQYTRVAILIEPYLNRRKRAGNLFMNGLKSAPSLSLISSLHEAHSPLGQRRQEGIISTPASRDHEQTEPNDVPRMTEVYGYNSENVKTHCINLERTTPSWIAAWNILNMIQGIGILGIPYACVQGGWTFIPSVLLMAYICCYTGRLLGECLYKYPDQSCKNYFNSSSQIHHRIRVRLTNACIAANVLPCGGRKIATTVVILELFGAAVLYLILAGQCASSLSDQYLAVRWSCSLWTLIIANLCLPALLCPRMKVIAWFSVFALIGLFASIGLIMAYYIMEAIKGKFNWSNLPVPSPDEIPISLNIIIFSFCAHSALPGIEGSMRKAEDYSKVLNISFSIAAVVKLVFGLFSALVLGKAMTQSVTDTMGNYPILSALTQFFLIVNVFFSLPLVFYIIGEHLDDEIASYMNTEFYTSTRLFSLYHLWFLSSRTAVLQLALLCGILVPHFALVMSLIGAITGSLLCFIFPGSFHLYLFWPHLTCFEKVSRFVIILFGIFVGGLGITVSCMAIQNALYHNE